MTDLQPVRTEAEIREWLVEQLTTRAQLDREEIRLDAPLVGLGVDSMQFVVLVGELEDWLGCRFTSNPLVVYPTTQTLAAFLASELQQGRRVVDPYRVQEPT